MLVPVLLIAMQFQCPMTIGIGRDGAIFASRLRGWYKTSQKTLESDLRGGCYNDANPTPVTSVKVIIAAGTPKSNTDRVFSILDRNGWPKNKVHVESWKNYPKPPAD